MKQEPAQSDAYAYDASAKIPLENRSIVKSKVEKDGGELSQEEVLRRMFAPGQYLPKPRPDVAIVVVTTGGTERAVTHHQIDSLIASARDQLKERGVKSGDRIVLYCENAPEFTSMLLACWSLNAMTLLTDYRAKRSDVLAMARKLGTKLLITSKKPYMNYATEITSFTEEGIDVLDISQLTDFNVATEKWQFDVQSLDLDRPALAILTSGTTGAPKTAVHSLRSLVQNIIDLTAAANLPANITALTPLPLGHIFGLSVFFVTQVIGAKTVLTQLNPVGFVKAVHRHKPELIAALPQFYGALLSAPKGYIDLSNARLLLCGGAPLTVSLSHKFESTFEKPLNNGYGSTECNLVAFNQGGPVLSVGKPVGSVTVDIVNEQDELLREGETGEVRITGSMLMRGYLNNEQESRKVLRNGHYYTGDIGRIENGYLFVAGRKGDVIIVGGVVVACGLVEEALRNHRAVKDVAVTAVPNKWFGEIIKASVVLVDSETADQLKSSDSDKRREAQRQLRHEFRTYCREHLPRYHRPMKWEFLGPRENLPKTLAGKTDKKTM